MGHNDEFNLLSLNVRGIRTFEKRKAVFIWLVNSGADIFFLQETYSTGDIENIWRKQWKGEMFSLHGSNHSRGVLVLIRDNLDFKINSTKVDSHGCYSFLEAYIQDSPYFLLNIYSPKKCSKTISLLQRRIGYSKRCKSGTRSPIYSRWGLQYHSWPCLRWAGR